jgi:hypothetical protein
MLFGFPSSAISMYSTSPHEDTVRILICRSRLGCGACLSRTEDPQSRTSYVYLGTDEKRCQAVTQILEAKSPWVIRTLDWLDHVRWRPLSSSGKVENGRANLMELAADTPTVFCGRTSSPARPRLERRSKPKRVAATLVVVIPQRCSPSGSPKRWPGPEPSSLTGTRRLHFLHRVEHPARTIVAEHFPPDFRTCNLRHAWYGAILCR